MQEYDATLKLLLRGSATVTVREVTGGAIANWLDVELPKVQNLRVDLLGETGDRALLHLELQSTNDAAMPLRMAEYGLSVFRLFDMFPKQILLYVGEAPLRMENELRGDDVWFRYRTVDIRSLDGERLLESADVGDNVIAVLARLRDHREAIRKIVGRIAELPPADRDAALSRLLILAGLRRLEETVEEEARRMPLMDSILDNKVLGREYKRGLAEGEAKGEMKILRPLMEKRFGVLPKWAEEVLHSRSAEELVELGLRVLEAPTLEDLLKSR